MLEKTKRMKRKSLFLLIVRKRHEMIRIANSNGLLSNETIRCSQELDSLLNTFNRYRINK